VDFIRIFISSNFETTGRDQRLEATSCIKGSFECAYGSFERVYGSFERVYGSFERMQREFERKEERDERFEVLMPFRHHVVILVVIIIEQLVSCLGTSFREYSDAVVSPDLVTGV